MLSDFEAAVEAALLRQSISSRDIADPSKSIKNRNEYLLKNSEGRVVDKISLERVNQLKDPEELKKLLPLLRSIVLKVKSTALTKCQKLAI